MNEAANYSPLTRKLWLGAGIAVALAVAAWCLYDDATIATENAYIKADKLSLAAEVIGVVTEVRVKAIDDPSFPGGSSKRRRMRIFTCANSSAMKKWGRLPCPNHNWMNRASS